MPTGSTFNGVRHGIDITGMISPQNPHWIYNNHFYNCEAAINIYNNIQTNPSDPNTGLNNDLIYQNTITEGQYYGGSAVPFTNNVIVGVNPFLQTFYTNSTTNFVNKTFGIHTNFTDNLLVDDNEISAVDYGIVINRSAPLNFNSPANSTHVYRNTVFSLPYALSTGGRNDQISIRCNTFTFYNQIAWNIYDYLSGDGFTPQQGDGTFTPGNYFQHSIGDLMLPTIHHIF